MFNYAETTERKYLQKNETLIMVIKSFKNHFKMLTLMLSI